MLLEKIIDDAVSTDDKSFLQLVTNAISLQKRERERRAVGDALVDQGLVTVRKKTTRQRSVLVGDLHGDLQSLATILKCSGFLEAPSDMLVFMGDYGDRGIESVEVYHVVLHLKATFPERVILMRGNHEGPADLPFFPHDLPDQMTSKFGGGAGSEIYEQLRILFDLMHHGVLLENSYLVLHGGVPTSLSSAGEIANAGKTHPKLRHLEEILWNDPREIRGSAPSGRGYGMYFGKDLTERALGITGTKALIRAHEPCNGFRLDHEGLVLTLFSCKVPYGNSAASYLKLSGEGDYELNAEGLSKIVDLI